MLMWVAALDENQRSGISRANPGRFCKMMRSTNYQIDTFRYMIHLFLGWLVAIYLHLFSHIFYIIIVQDSVSCLRYLWYKWYY